MSAHPVPLHRSACEHPHEERHQHSHAHHGHGHGVSDDADRRYLRLALGLLTAFLIGEGIVAFGAHSLVLLSDAGHMLTDVAALGAALWAMTLAARPARGEWTYGWKRAEILSAAG